LVVNGVIGENGMLEEEKKGKDCFCTNRSIHTKRWVIISLWAQQCGDKKKNDAADSISASSLDWGLKGFEWWDDAS
jgi:hypothetical protein